MPYLNSRLYALLALGLSLVAVPGLSAQSASGAIRGDVDGDGRVTRADADAVRAYLVRGTVPASGNIAAGDANGDGRVTAADAALISRFAAGVDVSRFPVGRPVSEGGGRVASSEGAYMFSEYECTADTRAETLVCGLVAPGGGGARSDVLLYGTGAKAVVVSGPVYWKNDNTNQDTLTYTLALTNLLPQPIGTTDGVTGDTSRLVITGYVQTNAGAQLLTADGTLTFVDSVNGGPVQTFPNRQYMDYPGLIAPNATTAADTVRFVYNPVVTTLNFKYRIWSRVQYNHGNVVVAGADSIVGAGQTLSLSGSSYSVIGAALAPEGYTWSSSNPGVATVSSAGVVTGVAGGTTTITATSSTDNARAGTRVIRVIQANLENVGATGNVRLSAPASVLVNDSIHPNVRLTFYGWNGSPGVTQQGGVVAMDTTVAGGPNRGKFTYNPPAGFEGVDSLSYVIRAGSAVDTGKVALTVSGMIWFVDAGAASCTSRAAGCGRHLTPYSSLAAFNAENNGTGNNPAAGDAVFLYEGSHAGPVTLLAQQKLIGQDAAGDLATLAGVTLATGSDALPAMNPTGTAVTITGGGVTLANIGAGTGTNNTVRGLSISSTSGAALSGTSFGSPTIAEIASLSATGGPVLSLDNGTVNSTFPSATSTNSTGRGISLTNVNGSLAFTAGSISGAAQAGFLVSGGNVGVTWPGSIGQASTTPLLAVSGGHSGTLTFSGALTSTGGPGMQFNDADGVYNLNGTANLSGDSAAVDITNGSGGTFNFNSGTQITNAAGAANSAFYVYGSAPTLVSYAGSITKSGTSAGRLVELGEMTGGTVVFTSGSSLSATSSSATSTGVSLSNVAATVNFDGTTNLNGGDAGIDILSGSSGTFTFGANTLVQNPTGTAFNVNGSAPAVTFNGSLIRTANNALLVDLTTVAAGKTITFDPVAGTDSLYATAGDGIQLSNVDGAVDFNGRVRLAGGPAVDIINGSSGNIDFDAITVLNPATEALRIFNGSGGDQATDVSFAGSITTNAARPALVEDVGSGTVAVSASINTSAGLGLLVQNNSGGTITFSNATQVLNTAGNAAVTLSNNTGSTVNFTGGALDIDVTSGAGFTATGGGTVSVTGATNTVNSTGGGTAVNIANTTIGGSGVTFLSVAANGGTNGIVLNNTGTSAGLTVTGSGSAGSGGTIQNTSAAGIALTSTTSPSFSRMNIQSTGSHGISGALVNNFSLTNSTISGSGTSEVAGRQESNLSFYQNAGTGTERNLTGNVTISGNTFSNALHHGINITQYDGTITSLNVSNNTFTSATSSTGTSGLTASKGTGVNVNLIGSGSTIASLSGATISNNVITGFPGNAGILFSVGNANTGGPTGTYGTAADSITIQSNRIRGHSSANLMNTQAVSIAVNGRGTGFFRVLDNGTVAEPITNMAGHAINVSAFGTAVLNIRVTNNRIVANNTVGSNGISMGVDSAAGFTTTTVMNATVNANNVSATNGSGILVSATRSGTVNMKLLNNTVATPATATYGIQLRAASATTATGTVCFQLSGNTTSGGSGGGNTFPGFGLRRQSGAVTNGPNVFGLVGLSPSPAGTPTVENFVNAANTSASGTFGTGGTALASASTGFTSCTLSF